MPRYKPLLLIFIGLIILAGLIVRLYHISDNQFLFYDEGMYLGYNQAFLNLVANNPAHNFNEFLIILSLMFKTALTTAKALWFFILNLRVFVLGPQAWYFARWISAFSGIATVILLFFWARYYFKSQRVAVLSALLLLILPSHVFYSRLGMQEAFSTLLFLGAIYLYMSNDRIRWPFFVSAFLLACVYFTNYRMIIAPVFIAFIECFRALVLSGGGGRGVPSERRLWRARWGNPTTGPDNHIDLQKIVIYFVAFYGIVFFIGSLYDGVNNHVTFAWMFHQAQDAGGKFNPVNFLSYPYDVFALEGFLFACFFWGNLYFLKFKEYSKFLPFGIVVLQMLIFSFAAEKGARYLCVVLPFMAAAAAVAVDECWQRFIKLRAVIITVGILAVVSMVYQSGSIAWARTDYDQAVQFITDHDPQAVIISTQPLVEGLFLNDQNQIIPCPHDLYTLGSLYKQGARYLIVDPQAYISWTNDGRRFSPPLNDFLEVVLNDVKPLQIFPHLNKVLLNRFVLDHNEQLLDSIKFLSVASSEGYGKIRVYDLGSVFLALQRAHAGNLI
jgi:hypothetical protein